MSKDGSSLAKLPVLRVLAFSLSWTLVEALCALGWAGRHLAFGEQATAFVGIIVLGAGISVGIEALTSRWGTPGTTELVVSSLVLIGRYLEGDRFETTAGPMGTALVLLIFAARVFSSRPPILFALQAAAGALLGLISIWGKVPNSVISMDARIEFLSFPVIAAFLVSVLVAVGFCAGRRAIHGATAVAGFAVLFGLFWQQTRQPSVEPALADAPNVIVILVDTLQQELTITPSGESPVPEFGAFIQESLRFPRATTPIPKTAQAVASLFTGKTPLGHGTRTLFDPVADQNDTLAEVLAQSGYRTGAFVHNGWIQRGRGFEQGFRDFLSYFQVGRPYGLFRFAGLVRLMDWLTVKNLGPFEGRGKAPELTADAQAWIERQDGPYFAYLHYFDPHWPYEPGGERNDAVINNLDKHGLARGDVIFNQVLPAKDATIANQLYEEEVRVTLKEIARLCDWIKRTQPNTLVVFTADHGHHLGDHGYAYHHGSFLYEPGVLIPLALWMPGEIQAQVDTREASLIDILPTVLRLAEVDVPEEAEGIDLLDPAHRLPPGESRVLYLESDAKLFPANRRRPIGGNEGKILGVRHYPWKLMVTPTFEAPFIELFNLSTDPDELLNLHEDPSQRGMLIELSTKLEGHFGLETLIEESVGEAHGDKQNEGEAEEKLIIDPLEAEMLRSLGYIE